MKSNILSLFALPALLLSCSPQAMFPEGIATNSSFSNNPNAASNHERFSKRYADAHITVGKDNVLSIPLKFGTATMESRDSQGDMVWVYQARTSTVGTQAKFGSNYKMGFMSGSSASAFESMTETSKRITTLKVAFYKSGVVKSYSSTSHID